jgi:hypothetical protein
MVPPSTVRLAPVNKDDAATAGIAPRTVCDLDSAEDKAIRLDRRSERPGEPIWRVIGGQHARLVRRSRYFRHIWLYLWTRMV